MRILQQTGLTHEQLHGLDVLEQLAQILVIMGGHTRGIAEFLYHPTDGVYLEWNANIYTVNSSASIENTLRTLFRAFDASGMYLVENHMDYVEPSISNVLNTTWMQAREQYSAFQLTLDLLPT